MKRWNRRSRNGAQLPCELLMAQLCATTGLPPSELAAMSYEEAQTFCAYHDGRALAEWASMNPPSGAKHG